MITIPTISQLYTGVISDLETAYGVNINPVGKAFLRAVAAVQAARLKLMYLTLGSIQKNVFVDTADRDILTRWGLVKLNRGPFPATAGVYDITVTGTIGGIIPAGTTFKSNDDSESPGKLFIVDTAFTLATSPDTVSVRALEAGLDSSLAVSDELTATAPISLVDSLAVVSAETTTPLAAEDLEEYRNAIIESFQLEPQGGAGSDYRIWASDAQGVQTVYPYVKSGVSNEINLYVEATIADSTDGKGTPGAGILTDVESVVELDPDTTKPINERGRRPLGVHQIHYLAITPKDIDITITGFVGLTAAIQTAIENAIEEALADIRPFVSSIDPLADKNDIINTFILASVIQAANPGSIYTNLTFDVAGVTLSTYQFTNGDIPYLNSVSYV
jgi:uncharacterized phage protein gp47/JayE